jgi:hypothetical protein
MQSTIFPDYRAPKAARKQKRPVPPLRGSRHHNRVLPCCLARRGVTYNRFGFAHP